MGNATRRDRNWAITASILAVALVVVILMRITRHDEPGPSNANAKAACNEMTRISTAIIQGRSQSFAGRLDKVVTSAQAAAKDDKDYLRLAAAVKRLSEDPEIATEAGSRAIQTIAAECK